MRRDGNEKIAHWRESGAWWAGENPIEVVQWRDRRGIRHEKIRELSSLRKVHKPPDWQEDLSVEITLRPRKTRDEKVALACGAYQELPFPKHTLTKRLGLLHLVSGYSFGRSVMLAREIPRRLALAGYSSGAIVDRFALTGAVEFAHECKNCGVKPIIGSSLELDSGGEVILYAMDKHGYSNLSQLVTECHLNQPRLHPLCTFELLDRYAGGLLCVSSGCTGVVQRHLLRRDDVSAKTTIDRLVGIFGSSGVFLGADRCYEPWGTMLELRVVELSRQSNVPIVVSGRVTHAEPCDFPAQDVALCAETLCTVEEVVGRKLRRDPAQIQIQDTPVRSINHESYLRSTREYLNLYADHPEWLEATGRLIERCDDDVLPARTRLPQQWDSAADVLTDVTWAGANLYHKTISRDLKSRIHMELDRIIRLNFADHFLTIWELCRWAGDQGIHYSGRGSMVDSAVSFCLGLTRIDAHRHRLLFDRFLPEDGSKRPDIDVDFEAKRREDVRQYLTIKFGVDRVATVSAIGSYNTRGIIREVGKALGIENQAIAFLAKRIHGGVVPDQLVNALDKRPELRDSGIDKNRLEMLFELAHKLADLPRNIRAHSSGVVISEVPLSQTVPVQWAGPCAENMMPMSEDWLRIIQWDKRSAKHFFDKFDILCLRGQDVLSGTETRIRQQNLDFNIEKLPIDDQETYRCMRSGHLIGIPQSASPAMRQAHMRVKTNNLHDASLVQAGIRPGVGGAVKMNELIARRAGKKSYKFDHPDFESILGLTYGIVVFQEQIDQLLQVFAGYSSGEAEDIRDEIHKRRKEDYSQVVKSEIVERVIKRGYTESVAKQVFDYVAGFKGYGFAQGHALAFAEISVRSIYCQQNFPAEYFASLLDAQPAGYYGPCTLVNEARIRGVQILPPDINCSRDDFLVEDVISPQEPRLVIPQGGIRTSLRSVHGLSAKTRRKIKGEYRSFADFVRKVQPQTDELENLILCGAFDRLCDHRRALIWAARKTIEWAKSCEEGLFSELHYEQEPQVDTSMPDFLPAEKAVRERAILGIDVNQHLMSYEREKVSSKGGLTTQEVRHLPPGRKAICVGNPIRLRFPPTPSGKRVVFFDLEDETGLLNVTCFDSVYQQDGHAIVASPYVTLIGVTQWRDGHTAFLAKRVFPYNPHIVEMIHSSHEIPVRTADFLVG